jgi:hypothetical protein
MSGSFGSASSSEGVRLSEATSPLAAASIEAMIFT